MDLNWETFSKLAADETGRMQSDNARYELSDWGRFGWPVPLSAATEVFWKALDDTQQDELIKDLVNRGLLLTRDDIQNEDEFSHRYAYGTEIANLFYHQSMGNTKSSKMSTGTKGQASVE